MKVVVGHPQKKKWVVHTLENILFVDDVRRFRLFLIECVYEKVYIRYNGPCICVLQRVSLGPYLGAWNKMSLTDSYTCSSDAV